MSNNQSISPILSKAVNESIRNLSDSLKIIPDYLVELANLGWFITLNLTPRKTGELCLKIKKKNFQAIDKYMVAYVEQKLDRVERELIASLPDRAKPIQDGFRAYRKKEYFLSIPVLLAQIDGICISSLENHFFTSDKKKKKETREKYYDLNLGEILNAFFKPSGQKLEISKGKKEQQTRNRLVYNRHEIMHGIDSNYGNKLNCLKIISLLDYIAEITNSKNINKS